ncbi:MAG: Fic family protein [Bacteroidetes bacterium]|nr:Fic family protein [Bacteroidota bacterium]
MYVHEIKNWTDFRWNNENILPLLGNVRHLQGNLLGKMESIGFQLIEEAKLLTLTLDAVDTSKIEGEFLNPDEVRSSIARKMGIENAEYIPTSRNVDGIVDVLLDATQNFQNPLTETRLFGWHNSLFQTGFSGYQQIDVAKYRSAGMKIVSGTFGREKIHFEAPKPEQIKAGMDKFLEWFNSEDITTDAVLKAAIAHFWFVTIHPFDDGNGRLARAITDMQLARSDNSKIRFYSVSNQIYIEHRHYNDLIEKTQESDGDITDWLEWFLRCFERALLASEQNLKLILDKARFWDLHREKPINDRQRLVINYYYDNYGKSLAFLRTSIYAKLTKCSTDTALRDLQDLVSKEMLQVEDSGKKTNYLINSPSDIKVPKNAE